MEVTDDQRIEYEEAFVLFDKNGDGYVSESELEDVLRHLGADKGAYRLIEDFDDDGDGVLNKNEFVNFMASLQRDADSAEDAVRSFSIMVEDSRRSSGKVDMDTVVHILRSVGEPLSEQECRHLIEDAKPDIDPEGKLNYTDFIHRLLKQI